jgi:3-phenylpropionate/trans-cinnamate dioxygenase ferredoxin component
MPAQTPDRKHESAEATMSDWTHACMLDNIEVEGMRRFDHEGRTLAVYRSADDEVFCSDGLCTHEAVHLSGGLVMDYEIGYPKHAGVFDIRTGKAKRLPARLNLRTYSARLEDGRVHIAI